MACSYLAGHGDTWAQLAVNFYGSLIDDDFLAEANGADTASDPNGCRIIIPCASQLSACATFVGTCGSAQTLMACNQTTSGTVASTCHLTGTSTPMAAPTAASLPSPAAVPTPTQSPSPSPAQQRASPAPSPPPYPPPSSSETQARRYSPACRLTHVRPASVLLTNGRGLTLGLQNRARD